MKNKGYRLKVNKMLVVQFKTNRCRHISEKVVTFEEQFSAKWLTKRQRNHQHRCQ